MGRITVVTSGKGGSGKSTTSAALGSVFARSGRTVLLIDGDAGMRSLDGFLGITEKLVFDISDIFSGVCKAAKAIYPCAGVRGLFLLPAPPTRDKLVSATLMKRLAKGLAQYYDEIIIDSPAGVGEGFDAAVSPADVAIVVATPDPVCARDAAIVRTELQKRGIKEQFLLINKFNREFMLSGVVPDLDSIIDTSGLRLIGVVPGDPNALLDSGKGLAARPSGSYAEAYERIGKRLLGENVPLGRIEKF